MFARLWILFLFAWGRRPEAVRESTYEGVAYARSLASEVAGSGQTTQSVVTTKMQLMIEDPESFARDAVLPVKLSKRNLADLEMDGREAWNVFSYSSKSSGSMEWDGFELKRLAEAVGAIYDLKALAGLQYLCLDDTKVTDAGLAELKNDLPNCRITGP